MSTELIAPRKNKRSNASVAIAKAIIDEYQPWNAEEMQDVLKDIFGSMFEAILQGEMDSHLGYGSNDHGPKNTENRCNGYSSKTIKSTYGDITIEVPRDRDASFEPMAIPKRTKDVSGIEDKVTARCKWCKRHPGAVDWRGRRKHYWMQIFDGVKARGAEDVLFISMDGVSGLEEGAKSIFKDVVVQRCIVHLVRNSIRYIPSKDYKAFTAQ